jgi:hypothetical protein
MLPTPRKPVDSYRSLHQRLSRCQLMLIIAFLPTALVHAQTFTTLYNFRGGRDGKNTFAGVIQDMSVMV